MTPPCDGETLHVRKDRGGPVAPIEARQIVYATSWAQQDGGTSWLGLNFGHVVYFPDTTSIGGALSITWTIGSGALQTLVLGNRDGWLTRKGEPSFYAGLVQLLGSWVNMGAVTRLADIGGRAYARELGFDVADPTPAELAAAGLGEDTDAAPQPGDDDPRRSLERLEILRREGYVTDE